VLQEIIAARIANPSPESYTTRLLAQGARRVAQKVGEEGVELALAAVTQGDTEIAGEAADLLYHVIVLLLAKNLSLDTVAAELERRHLALRRDSTGR
jgi:phosphoribosyl-ATP pyrophosphohydrolase/phosphoribosyl-AMP cyclohydrolase